MLLGLCSTTSIKLIISILYPIWYIALRSIISTLKLIYSFKLTCCRWSLSLFLGFDLNHTSTIPTIIIHTYMARFIRWWFYQLWYTIMHEVLSLRFIVIYVFINHNYTLCGLNSLICLYFLNYVSIVLLTLY